MAKKVGENRRPDLAQNEAYNLPISLAVPSGFKIPFALVWAWLGKAPNQDHRSSMLLPSAESAQEKKVVMNSVTWSVVQTVLVL